MKKNGGRAQTTATRLQGTKCLIKCMGCPKKPRDHSPILVSVRSVLCTLAAAVEQCEGKMCVHVPPSM